MLQRHLDRAETIEKALAKTTARRARPEGLARQPMTVPRFKVGDHVSWNSEAGRVRGRITRIVTSPITFKGYTVHATPDDPQYEIKSDTTDHVAMHKGSALRRLSR